MSIPYSNENGHILGYYQFIWDYNGFSDFFRSIIDFASHIILLKYGLEFIKSRPAGFHKLYIFFITSDLPSMIILVTN